jgi:fluoroquinolone transport system permease protein
MKKLIIVAVNDFRLVFRDSSLKIFIMLPLLILLVMRYAVPYIADAYPVIQEYVSIILMLATTQGPVAFGFIYSMVLVDEKDTSVARVYGVLPLSKFWFVVFRLIPPFVLATLATFLLLLVEPFYRLPVVVSFAYSVLAGLVAPLMTLFVATIATNKIEAMTWQKLFNLPLFLPIAAFFIAAPVSLLFAIFPTYWMYQGFSALIEGRPSSGFLLAGFVYSLVLIGLMVRRFTRSHFV